MYGIFGKWQNVIFSTSVYWVLVGRWFYFILVIFEFWCSLHPGRKLFLEQPKSLWSDLKEQILLSPCKWHTFWGVKNDFPQVWLSGYRDMLDYVSDYFFWKKPSERITLQILLKLNLNKNTIKCFFCELLFFLQNKNLVFCQTELKKLKKFWNKI